MPRAAGAAAPQGAPATAPPGPASLSPGPPRGATAGGRGWGAGAAPAPAGERSGAEPRDVKNPGCSSCAAAARLHKRYLKGAGRSPGPSRTESAPAPARWC